MDGYISAGEVTAGGIAVTDLEGEEVVVGAGSSVVGHVHTKSDLLFADFARSSEVSLITIKAEAGDLQGAEAKWSAWIVVGEHANQFSLLSLAAHLLELDVQLEGGLTTFANRDRAVSIDVGCVNRKRCRCG